MGGGFVRDRGFSGIPALSKTSKLGLASFLPPLFLLIREGRLYRLDRSNMLRGNGSMRAAGYECLYGSQANACRGNDVC